MKKLLSMILALTLAFALAAPVSAEYLWISDYNVEFIDAELLGTVKVDGKIVPVYGIGEYKNVTRFGFTEGTVVTIYEFTQNADGTGTVGGRKYQYDWNRFIREGFTPGPYSSFYYYFDETDTEGYSAYYEITQDGDAIFSCVLRHVKPIAYARTQTVELDGKSVTLPAYALKDENGNETNYVKLRDLASLLNGTAAQFNVGWNGEVNIETKTPYVPNGSEMTTPFSGDRAYHSNLAGLNIDGELTEYMRNSILLNDDEGGGYTYFKLRDIGMALGFNVGWSAERGIYIETDKPYMD